MELNITKNSLLGIRGLYWALFVMCATAGLSFILQIRILSSTPYGPISHALTLRQPGLAISVPTSGAGPGLKMQYLVTIHVTCHLSYTLFIYLFVLCQIKTANFQKKKKKKKPKFKKKKKKKKKS